MDIDLIIYNSLDSVLKGIAKRVKERRLERNLTQKTFARRAGVGYDVYRKFENTDEITFSPFIIAQRGTEADPNDRMFQHEYGHVLQSRDAGWSYLFSFGLPSLWSATINSPEKHNSFSVEQDANKRGYEYFYNKTGGSVTWDNSNEILDKNWQNMIHSKYAQNNPIQNTSRTMYNPNMNKIMYNPTTISPYTPNHFNWTVQGEYFYQGIDDYWKKYKKSVDRLRVLLSLYK